VPLLDPPLTDIGNAERLVQAHGQDLRYCASMGIWRVWDGRRWPADDLGDVELRAKDVARTLFELADRAKGDVNSSAQKQREQLLKFALLSENDSRIRAALRRARVEPAVAVRAREFDVDGWLLNVENGTLDLRTGQLRPHRREDLITKLATTRFDPAARCLELEAFLDWVTGADLEYRLFIERVLGYALAAERQADVVLALVGPGRTGKTTLLEAIRQAMGDYAYTMPFSALLKRERPGQPRPELVDARGCRIVVASEAQEDGTFDTATLKAISGGDTMNARRLNENPVEFRPTYTLLLAANQLPRMRDEPATRARLRVLPFDHVFDGVSRLRERLQEPDARAALLAIAVRGCGACQRDGLGTCEAVERATRRYWGDRSNPRAAVERFIVECCERDAQASCAAGELFERFVETQAADDVSLTKFGTVLTALGFGTRRTNRCVLRLGLRLKVPGSESDR
jgi:putative DNA primase/helicase